MPTAVEFILKASDEASKEVQHVAGEVTNLVGIVGRLGGAAGAWGTLAAGAVTAGTAVVGLTRHYTENVEHLDRIAKAGGATAGEVQVLETAFKRLGLETDKADQAVLFMARSIGQHKKALADLGITTGNAVQAINEFARKTSGPGVAAGDRMRLSMELLGRAGRGAASAFPVLAESAARSEQVLRRFGGYIDEGLVPAALKLDDRMDDLVTGWESMWRRFTIAMMPAVDQIISALEVLMPTGDDVKAWGEVISGVVAPLVIVILELADALIYLANIMIRLAGVSIKVFNDLMPWGHLGNVGKDVKEFWEGATGAAEKYWSRTQGMTNVLLRSVGATPPPPPALFSAHRGEQIDEAGKVVTLGRAGTGADELGDVGARLQSIRAIQNVLGASEQAAEALLDRLDAVKERMQGLQAVADLRLLPEGVTAQVQAAIDGLTAIKDRQKEVDLRQEIRLLGPNAPAPIKEAEERLLKLGAALSVVKAQHEIQLMGPGGSEVLQFASDKLEVLKRQLDVMKQKRIETLMGPAVSNEVTQEIDRLRALEAQLESTRAKRLESMTAPGAQRELDELNARLEATRAALILFGKDFHAQIPQLQADFKALNDELARTSLSTTFYKNVSDLHVRLGLTVEQAAAFQNYMDRISKEDALAGLNLSLDKDRGEMVQTITELDHALTGSAEGARDLGLKLAGVSKADLTPLEQQVTELGRAAHAFKEEMDASSALQGLRPLLSSGKLDQEQKKKLGGALMRDDLENFQRALDATLNKYNVFKAGIDAINDAVYNSFSTVFANMIGSTQKFSDVLNNIVKSMVNNILAELGRLVAAGFLKLFAKVVGNIILPGIGGLVAGTLVSGADAIIPRARPTVPSTSPLFAQPRQPLPPVSPLFSQPRTAFPPASPLFAQRQALIPVTAISLPRQQPAPVAPPAPTPVTARKQGHTYIINALDARTVIRDLMSPMGGLRRAGDSVRVAGAY